MSHSQLFLSPSLPLFPTLTTAPRSHYFSHLATSINRSLFSPAHSFDRPGLYIYKRPVRSGTPQHQALLSTAGTLLHHVVIYIKTPGTSSKLIAMEFGPESESMVDITTDIRATAPPDHSRLLSHDPELPERQCLPMLRVDLPHHHVDADPVVKAIQFAASKNYQVMSNNCIQFACFMIFVLTKGRLRNAPLVFDVVCGKIPIHISNGTSNVSSSLLDMMMAMMGMSWYDAVDGGRLIREFLEQHPDQIDVLGGDDGDGNDVPPVLLSSSMVVSVPDYDEEKKKKEKECGSDDRGKTVERDDKVKRMRMMRAGRNTTTKYKQGVKRRVKE